MNETIIKDLEILEKYLTQDELKEIAKEVAYKSFDDSIGASNSENRESNYDWYLKQGALEAVREHISDFDAKALTIELQDKTRKLINSLQTYNLPNTYNDIAKNYILDHKDLIENKLKVLISNFVNSENYDSAYQTFTDRVGEQLADLLYNLLQKEFKNGS